MKLLLILLCFSSSSSEIFYSNDAVGQKYMMENMVEQNVKPKQQNDMFGKHNNLAAAKLPVLNDTIQLFKFAQSYFYGEVLLGHPGQTLKVVFDTSSSISWVPSVQCSPFAYPPCALRNKFNSLKSTTYKYEGTSFTLDTDKGRLFGYTAFEKFHIGHINITNQVFVEIEEMSLMQLFYISYDGSLGLGLEKKNDAKKIPFVINLFKQYPKMLPIVSFYFNRDETTSKGGSVFFGGSNKKHYNGTFTYLPVTNSEFWEIKLDKIEVKFILPYENRTATVCSNGCNAFMNTVDVNIYGPEKEVKIINKIVGANYVPILDRYEISCNKIHKLPYINFYFGRKAFIIYGRDYVQQVKYGPLTVCLSAFTPFRNAPSNTNIWGIGISFLGRYCMELNVDKKVVGFAKSNSPL